MSELDYIGADELVFNNDAENGIHSGGFSVNSIMMKAGMSPIMTMNMNIDQKGGSSQVSDLFNDLVVPNWVLSYNNRIGGGKYKERDDGDSDVSDDVIDDDLHEKLLSLVKEHEHNKMVQRKKKMTRRPNKNKKSVTKKMTKNV